MRLVPTPGREWGLCVIVFLSATTEGETGKGDAFHMLDDAGALLFVGMVYTICSLVVRKKMNQSQIMRKMTSAGNVENLGKTQKWDSL